MLDANALLVSQLESKFKCKSGFAQTPFSYKVFHNFTHIYPLSERKVWEKNSE